MRSSILTSNSPSTSSLVVEQQELSKQSLVSCPRTTITAVASTDLVRHDRPPRLPLSPSTITAALLDRPRCLLRALPRPLPPPVHHPPPAASMHGAELAELAELDGRATRCTSHVTHRAPRAARRRRLLLPGLLLLRLSYIAHALPLRRPRPLRSFRDVSPAGPSFLYCVTHSPLCP
jgi:hypothetical protein